MPRLLFAELFSPRKVEAASCRPWPQALSDKAHTGRMLESYGATYPAIWGYLFSCFSLRFMVSNPSRTAAPSAKNRGNERLPMYRRIAGLSIMILAAAIGCGLGVGSYTFIYAKGISYLSNEPRVCANCHIMQNHFDAWAKGSHHAVATCNDCHTPHALIPKYYTKARNGYRHALAFTTGNFHEPIQTTEFNRNIAEANCRYCHQDIVEQIDFGGGSDEPMECIRCHSEVGHME